MVVWEIIAGLVQGLAKPFFGWLTDEEKAKAKSEAESKAAAMKSVGEAAKVEKDARNAQDQAKAPEIRKDDGVDVSAWNKPDSK